MACNTVCLKTIKYEPPHDCAPCEWVWGKPISFIYCFLEDYCLILLPITQIMIMIMSETSSLFGPWFCEIKLQWEIKLISWKSIRNRNLFLCFICCCFFFSIFFWIVNYNSILNIFLEVVLAISSKIYTNYKLISRAMLPCYAPGLCWFPQDWFHEINKTDFAKSTGLNNFFN